MYGYGYSSLSTIIFDEDLNRYTVFGIPLESVFNKNTVMHLPNELISGIMERTGYSVMSIIAELESRLLGGFDRELLKSAARCYTPPKKSNGNNIENFQYFRNVYNQAVIKYYSMINSDVDCASSYYVDVHRKGYINIDLADKNVMSLEYDRFFKKSSSVINFQSMDYSFVKEEFPERYEEVVNRCIQDHFPSSYSYSYYSRNKEFMKFAKTVDKKTINDAWVAYSDGMRKESKLCFLLNNDLNEEYAVSVLKLFTRHSNKNNYEINARLGKEFKALPSVTFLNVIEFLIVNKYNDDETIEHFGKNNTFEDVSIGDMEAKLFPLSVNPNRNDRVASVMNIFKKIKEYKE